MTSSCFLLGQFFVLCVRMFLECARFASELFIKRGGKRHQGKSTSRIHAVMVAARELR